MVPLANPCRIHVLLLFCLHATICGSERGQSAGGKAGRQAACKGRRADEQAWGAALPSMPPLSTVGLGSAAGTSCSFSGHWFISTGLQGGSLQVQILWHAVDAERVAAGRVWVCQARMGWCLEEQQAGSRHSGGPLSSPEAGVHAAASSLPIYTSGVPVPAPCGTLS